ncbi:hypothetical protein BCD67_04215 [Oscillatoriales cyanobacterium USR001]|nr:hypothetical protein BCD67_04215 [Oscillatoriales cyanobacterium USR001]
MIPNSDLLTYSQWMGILTLIAAVFTVFAFVLKWGFRFRFVGVTGFLGVLTIGIFSLSLGLYTRAEISGAIPYTLVYDNGGAKTVIAVPPTIAESELEATMRQAAGDLFSFGRGGGVTNLMTIRVRTILHPKSGVSLPLYLGEVRRSLSVREDDKMAIDIFPDSLARLKESQV